MMKSQETCPNAIAAFERPRKGVQAAAGNSAQKKSRRRLSPLRRRKATGFCFFNLRREGAEKTQTFGCFSSWCRQFR